MDAYFCYNHIKMYPLDEEKTTFTTGQGIFCYKVMPFGLKNAGATFRRMVDKVFKNLIGHTMKLYVDNLLVKSTQHSDHLCHLIEAFNMLQKYKVKLNPKKCTFGVASGMFLGLFTQQGIETRPGRISTILDIKSPACSRRYRC